MNTSAIKAIAEPSDLTHLLSESHLVCVEIGLSEIEAAAGIEVGQIHISEIAAITAKALRNRPEHVVDILLVSSWIFSEALCTDAQRDMVRQHYHAISQDVENAQC